MPFNRPEIIRPPSEWRSYYLPLTACCSNNSCTFCNFHGSRLQVRDINDVKGEIDAVAMYTREGLLVPGTPESVYAIAHQWDRKGLFLQDGDALVYPLPQLKEVLRYINEKLPSVERIASYATAQDVLRVGLDDLMELRKLKLGILYMGLESGDDEVLKGISKRVTSTQIVEAGRKIKEAGILSSVTVILGLGGIAGSEKHAIATATALSKMDPDYVGALTLTLVQGTPLYEDYRQGKFQLISPFQSLQELKLIIEHAAFTNCFFSSMHASNYFSIRGRLAEDKARMLGELETVLKKGDRNSLRPEFMRGL